MDEQTKQLIVDLYAGEELPEHLELLAAAEMKADPEMRNDASSLRHLVRELKALEAPEFDEEARQRILIRMAMRGADVEPQREAAGLLQFRLAIAT